MPKTKFKLLNCPNKPLTIPHMSKKYYATITLKVVVEADSDREADLAIDEATLDAAETIEDIPGDVDLLDCSFTITDVK